MLQLLKGKQICTFESLGISHFNPNYYLIFPVKSEMKHESVLSQNIVGLFYFCDCCLSRVLFSLEASVVICENIGKTQTAPAFDINPYYPFVHKLTLHL